MVAAIREQWTDETLKEEKDMYGQMWPIGTTLELLVAHQTHHRGQMTVLMRQAGLTIPGIYGPAKRRKWAHLADKHEKYDDQKRTELCSVLFVLRQDFNSWSGNDYSASINREGVKKRCKVNRK